MLPEAMLQELALSIAAAIRSCPDVLEGKMVDVPDLSNVAYAAVDQQESLPRPRAYRFVESIASLNENQSMQNIVDQLCAVEDHLVWGHAPGYTKEKVGQQFLDNYCHALLSGPDGPLRCESPLGAFVLFGPDTLYRDHSHAPNEVYLAVTGGGEWRVGRHYWKQLDAGDTIFIPSHAVHAIRTGSEPLLTFSFWLEPGAMETIDI